MPDKAAGGEWKKGGKRKKRMGKKQETEQEGEKERTRPYTQQLQLCAVR